MPIDLTALLKEWGVTITLLSVAGTACLVIFVISFREFASWFVRINQVLRTQEEILETLRRLEAATPAAHAAPPEVKPAAVAAVPKVSQERFQLHI